MKVLLTLVLLYLVQAGLFYGALVTDNNIKPGALVTSSPSFAPACFYFDITSAICNGDYRLLRKLGAV